MTQHTDPTTTNSALGARLGAYAGQQVEYRTARGGWHHGTAGQVAYGLPQAAHRWALPIFNGETWTYVLDPDNVRKPLPADKRAQRPTPTQDRRYRELVAIYAMAQSGTITAGEQDLLDRHGRKLAELYDTTPDHVHALAEGEGAAFWRKARSS